MSNGYKQTGGYENFHGDEDYRDDKDSLSQAEIEHAQQHLVENDLCDLNGDIVKEFVCDSWAILPEGKLDMNNVDHLRRAAAFVNDITGCFAGQFRSGAVIERAKLLRG